LEFPVSNVVVNDIKVHDADHNKTTSIPDDIEGVDDNEEEDPQGMGELKEKLRICFRKWRRYI